MPITVPPIRLSPPLYVSQQPPGETHALAEFKPPVADRGFFGRHLPLRFVLIFSTAICASVRFLQSFT